MLCAISTTGELSEGEQQELEGHLAVCPECRRACEEFASAAYAGAPLVSARLAKTEAPQNVLRSKERSRRDAPAALQIENSQSKSHLTGAGSNLAQAGRDGRHRQINWSYLWVPFAAALILIAALAIYSYRAGTRQGSEIAQTLSTTRMDRKIEALEQKLSDAGHEREVLEAQVAERDRLVRGLRYQLTNESAALNQIRSAEANLQRTLQNDQAEKQQVAQEQNDLRRKLSGAQALLESTRVELAAAQRDRREDQLLGQSLEAQVDDLNAQLRSREQAIGKRDDLLAYDRDIRDLISARDLYIAEVYDVARDGSTRKPYGRIFYTQGKSLIFYAYDLDEQPGVKTASSFQAWGQRGPDRQQALNLGIFYQDNVAKKRWILKFDDPRKLDQINAVFVTVEPHGGSKKPDGKSLLFASLRIQPNHP